MKFQKKTITSVIALFTIFLVFSACSSSLSLKQVDYSYKLESVQKPGPDGVISDQRHGIKFNILPIQQAELKDTSSVKIEKVHLIRNAEGYYFITAGQFRHVYVMKPEEGALVLEKKVQVHKEGLEKPAFNWRPPYVELIHSDKNEAIRLNKEGIIKDKGEKKS